MSSEYNFKTKRIDERSRKARDLITKWRAGEREAVYEALALDQDRISLSRMRLLAYIGYLALGAPSSLYLQPDWVRLAAAQIMEAVAREQI